MLPVLWRAEPQGWASSIDQRTQGEGQALWLQDVHCPRTPRPSLPVRN